MTNDVVASLRLAAVALFMIGIAGCPGTMPGDGDPDPGGPVDTDGDGVSDADDECPDTPAEAEVDADGCAASQRDGDSDGVTDDVDECPDTAAGVAVDEVGCPESGPGSPADADGDGVRDETDDCPNTPAGAAVNEQGCSASQRDTDGDGVVDSVDQCAGTPAGREVDDTGCPVGEPGAPDGDDDGVGDDVDECPDTPEGAVVNRAGCAASERDSDGDGVTDDVDECPETDGVDVNDAGCASNQRDGDGDGVTDDVDQCPSTRPGAQVTANGCERTGGGGGGGGTDPVCGNGVVESGEQCEPPGSRCCNDDCQNVTGGQFNADNCADNTTLCDDEGSFAFDNTNATQDGPAHTGCVFFSEDQIDHDVWSCWTAPCTGTVFVSTCDTTTVDTKVAVYDGCACPVTDARLLSCNDDVCDVQSQATFEAVAGQGYLVRLGTFPAEAGGAGSVNITCGVEACPGTGDCFAPHAGPGCESENCCELICAVDPFCCEEEWDQVCADEAEGFCGDGFTACAEGAGSCTDPEGNGTPGCDDVECCNAVCLQDPFCCGVGGEEGEWDNLCAEQEAATCFTNCGARRGNCFNTTCDAGTNAGQPCTVDDDCPGGVCAGNGTAGCELEDCCAEVCPRDPFCCQIDWDAPCAEMAREFCSQP